MKGWYQITVVQSSCTCTTTKARDWRRDQRVFFCHCNANRHRWLWPEQGIKSVGQHPMGEPWASPWSQMTVIGRKIATAKCGQLNKKTYMRIQLNFFWEIAACAVRDKQWVSLSGDGNIYPYQLGQASWIILTEGFTIDDAVRILYNLLC